MKAITLLDILLLLLLCLCAGFSIPRILNSGPAVVKVHRDNVMVAEYPLSELRSIHFDGPAGGLTLDIRDGKVQVAGSSCRRHVCMQQGRVGPGGQLCCVPNHILVTVESKETKHDAVDGIVQ